MAAEFGTLSFLSSLRESVDPFLGLCYCHRHEVVFTIDKSAVRLWSFQKQLKCLHIEQPKHKRLLHVVYNYDTDCFIVLYSVRKLEQKGVLLQFWRPSLSLIHEIELDLPKAVLSTFCPKSESLIILDVENNISQFYLEALPEPPIDPKSKNLFAKDSTNLPKKTIPEKSDNSNDILKNMLMAKQKYEVARVTLVQTITEAVEWQQISTIKFLEENMIGILVGSHLLIYTRPGAVTMGPKMSLNSSLTGVNNNHNNTKPFSASSHQSSSRIIHSFNRIRVIDFAAAKTHGYRVTSARPTSMERLRQDLLAVAQEDGMVNIYLCHLLSSDPSLRIPQLLTSFKAHEVTDGVGVTAVHSTHNHTMLGEGYLVELFTVGGDDNICHWGIRKNPEILVGSHSPSANRSRGQSSHSVTASADLLGKQKLATPPSSHVKTAVSKSDSHPKYLQVVLNIPKPPFPPPAPPSLLPPSLASKVAPVAPDPQTADVTKDYKGLTAGLFVFCGLGGLLSIFSIQPPVQLVKKSSKDITAVLFGPTPMDLLNDSLQDYPLQSHEASKDSFAVLSDDVVEFFSSDSAAPIHQVFTSHLQDMGSAARTLDRISGSISGNSSTNASVNGRVGNIIPERLRLISKDNALQSGLNWVEGRPTAMTWCPHTAQLVVGFSSGGSGLISVRRNTAGPHALINSCIVHGAAIRSVASFVLPPKMAEDIMTMTGRVVVVLGDETGVLSMWQISPRRIQGKLWSAEAHQGAISIAKMVSIDAPTGGSDYLNKEILVTACSGGLVKTWLPTSDGSLTMIGVFSTRKPVMSLAVAQFKEVPPLVIESQADEKEAGRVSRSNPVVIESEVPQKDSVMIYLYSITDENSLGSNGSNPHHQPKVGNSNDPVNPSSKEDKHGPKHKHSEDKKASDSSADKPHEKSALPVQKSFELIYVCGFQRGLVETWGVKTSKGSAPPIEPTVSVKLHQTKITSIEVTPHQFESDADEDIRYVVSASLDGVVWLSSLENDGTMVNLKFFALTSPLLRILLKPIYHSSSLDPPSLELIGVGDTKINRFLVFSTKIPEEWKKSFDDNIAQSTREKIKRPSIPPKPRDVKNQQQAVATGRNNQSDQTLKESSVKLSQNISLEITGSQSVQYEKEFKRPKSPSSAIASSGIPGSETLTKQDTDDARISRALSEKLASNLYPQGMVYTAEEHSGQTGESRGDQDSTASTNTHLDGGIGPPSEFNVDGFTASVENQMVESVSVGLPYDGLPYNEVLLDIDGIQDPKLKAKLIDKLYMAKKDGRLHELYLFYENKTSQCVFGKDIPEMLEKWMKIGSLSVESITALLEFLNITPETRLSFFDVAKLGASIGYAFNFNPGLSMTSSDVKGRLQRAYRDMKIVRTTVRYNSMGEKVVEKIPLGQLAAGIFNGYKSELRSLWDQQPSRVPVHINESSPIFPSTILKEIPLSFRKSLHGGFDLPNHWSPSIEHWFDLRRTLRVARTILDIRLASQQDFILRRDPNVILYLKSISNNEGKKEDVVDYYVDSSIDLSPVAALPDCLVKYFQRNYGLGLNNVTQQKVVHFLEACLQYSEYPLLNFLRSFLCPQNEAETLPDVCLWFYVEAYHYVRSHGMIEEGEPVPSHDPIHGSHLIQQESVNSNGSALQMRWLTIKRKDALDCVEEMFLFRGKFGVKILESMRQMVLSMPAVNGIFESESFHEDWLDLDSTLELLSKQVAHVLVQLSKLENVVFGEQAVPETRTTTANQSAVQSKRPSLTCLPSFNDNYDHFHEDEAMMEIVHHNNLLNQLRSLREFFLLFIENDPDRGGLVSGNVFRELCVFASKNILEQKKFNVVEALIEAAMRSFADPVTEMLSYIDFTATVLSHLIQVQGHGDLSCDDMVEAVLTVQRGIELRHYAALQDFMTSVPLPIRTDPLWTCSALTGLSRQIRSSDSNAFVGLSAPTPGPLPYTSSSKIADSSSDSGQISGSIGSSQISLPMQGHWRPANSLMLPSVGPGALTVTGITLERRDAQAPVISGSLSEIWLDREISRTTDKSRTSVVSFGQSQGEHPAPTLKHPAPLYTQDIIGQVSNSLSDPNTSVSFDYSVVKSFQKEESTLDSFFARESFPSLTDTPHGFENITDGTLGTQSDLNDSTFRSISPMGTTTLLERLLNEPNPSNDVIRSASRQASRGIDRTYRFGDRGSLTDSSRPLDESTTMYVGSPFEDAARRITQLGGSPQDAEGDDLEKRVVEFRERIRRPDDEKGVDSMIGRYTAQGRAVSPIVITSEEFDLDLARERDRLHSFRQQRIRDIHSKNVQSRLHQLHGDSLPDPVDGFDADYSPNPQHSKSTKSKQKRGAEVSQAMLEVEKQLEATFQMEIEAQLQLEKEMEKFADLHALKKQAEAQALLDIKSKNKENAQRAKKTEEARQAEKKRLKDEETARKKARDDEIALQQGEERRRILDAKRQKAAAEKLEQQAKEVIQEQKRREQQELLRMREEDEYSSMIEFEFVDRELANEKSEKLRKLVEEEEKKRIAKQELINMIYEAQQMSQFDFDVPTLSLDSESLSLEDDEDVELEESSESLEEEDNVLDEYLEDDPYLGDEVRSESTKSDNTQHEPRVSYSDLSQLQQKIRDFLDKMQGVANGNKGHPRKNREFFMPMLFSNDIVFDPFESLRYPENGCLNLSNEEGIQAEEKETVNTTDFSDITDKIKAMRDLTSGEEMLRELYRTSRDNIPIEDWTSVIRTNKIDWERFFKEEKDRFLADADDGSLDEDEQEFQQALETAHKQRLKSGHTATPSSRHRKHSLSLGMQDNTKNPEKSLIASMKNIAGVRLEDVDDFKPFIQPLPFGQVKKHSVEAGAYQIFQIEVPDSSTVLTIELKCKKGTANLYIAKDRVATETTYDYKALYHPNSSVDGASTTTSSSHSGHITRLVIKPALDFKILPGKPCTFIASVHGTHMGALFTIWTFASTTEIPKANPHDPIVQKIRGLQELATYTHEDISAMLRTGDYREELKARRELNRNPINSNSSALVTNIPLEIPHLMTKFVIAGNTLTSERSQTSRESSRQSASREFRNHRLRDAASTQSAGSDVTVSTIDEDKMVVDNFVSRAGRKLIKIERTGEKGTGGNAVDESKSSPSNKVTHKTILKSKANIIDPNFHAELYLPPPLPSMPSPVTTERSSMDLSQDVDSESSARSSTSSSSSSESGQGDHSKSVAEEAPRLQTKSMKIAIKKSGKLPGIPTNLSLQDQLPFYDKAMQIITGHTFATTAPRTFGKKALKKRRLPSLNTSKSNTALLPTLPLNNVNSNVIGSSRYSYSHGLPMNHFRSSSSSANL